MRANTGEAAAAGYTDENVSWRKPGSVSSSVATAPPARSDASSTSTRHPERAISIAAAKPFGPEPTTRRRSSSAPRIWMRDNPALADLLLRRAGLNPGAGQRLRALRRAYLVRRAHSRWRRRAHARARRRRRPAQGHPHARRRALHRHDPAQPPALGPHARAAVLRRRRPHRLAADGAAARAGQRRRRRQPAHRASCSRRTSPSPPPS